MWSEKTEVLPLPISDPSWGQGVTVASTVF